VAYHLFFGKAVLQMPASKEEAWDDEELQFGVTVECAPGEVAFGENHSSDEMFAYAPFDYFTDHVDSPRFREQWREARTSSGPIVYPVSSWVPHLPEIRADAERILQENPDGAAFLDWWCYWIEESVRLYGNLAALKIH